MGCMMKELSSVMSKFEPSATIKISRMIKDYKSRGFDVVDFGVGEPNFNLFDNIKKAGIDAINNNKNRYTPVSGIPSLKKAIIEKFNRENLGILPESVRKKVLSAIKLFEYVENPEHYEATTKIVEAMRHNDHQAMNDWILKAAEIRKFLG